jgi:hypothetical protein
LSHQDFISSSFDLNTQEIEQVPQVLECKFLI